MKIPIGKTVLTLMLVCTMALGCVESVKASEPLYYYDKYSVTKNAGPSGSSVTAEAKLCTERSIREDDGIYSIIITKYFHPFYRDVGVDSNGQVIGKNRILNNLTLSEMERMIGNYMQDENGEIFKLDNYIGYTGGAPPFKTGEGDLYVKFEGRRVRVFYSRGSFVDTIIGTYNQYPTDGIHSDGYWYVRRGLANKNPEITISTPTENSYFGKEKPINISGTVKDTDSGDTLTIKYTISGITAHTNKILRTITANGSNQSFNNNISIDTSISEGTHILKVWVEDNNGAKSSEISRTIIVDKTPPITPVLNLDESWTNENRTFTVTGGADNTGGSGLDRIEYRIGNGAWTRYSTIVTALSNSGTIQVQARAIDNVGNISSVVSKTARVDKAPPILILTPDIIEPTNKDVTIRAKAEDNLSGVKEIVLPDGLSVMESETNFLVEENGEYTFKAIDKAGNEVEENIIISNIDKVPPVITIEEYSTEWTNEDLTVYATVDKGTLNQDSYTFTENGSFIFVARDIAGNVTEKEVTITNIDKASPVTPTPTITVNSNTEIIVEAIPTDDLSGLHEEYILWNKDGMDLGSWTKENVLVDSNLKPNTKYTYKYKARDKVQNISEYSDSASRYTLASYPIKVKLNDYTTTSAAFTIFNDETNGNIPENKIILKEKDTDIVVAESEWTKEETIIIKNLLSDKNYEVWLNTRNEDKVENGEIKLSSTSEPPLVDYNNNPIDDFITSEEEVTPVITIKPYNTAPTNQDITVYATVNKGTLNQESYTFTENGSFTFIAKTLLGNVAEKEVIITNIDKVPPVITIEEYSTEWTNEDITVYATVDKGTLNQDSYTFTENGSFTFIAIDEAGNRSEKTVTISNIDKTLPTEGEITVIAVDEEGRTIKTIHKKNLGLGVQVVTAPDILGYELISTPVVTVWLKPADNVKQVTFTYKLDQEWKGWEEAEKVVEEAEKKVEEAENNPTEKRKEEAQNKIDEARDIVEKLPESDKKDELNKKLDDLQNRLDKVIIPKENLSVRDKLDNDDSKKDVDKTKTDKPEVENITPDQFVARWKGHEVLSQEPILIEEKSKAVFEVEEKQINLMDEKGLSPRFYKWNEEKEKWVAMATKVDENKIETYKDVEGYVAAFAVVQPIFSDVKGNEWYAEIADRANGLALIEGYTDNKGETILKPNNSISRSEFYAITARLFGAVQEGDNSLYEIVKLKSTDDAEKILFSTDYEVLDWAKPYIAALYEKNIIKEIEGRTKLDDSITRIEAIDALSKLLREVEDIDNIDLNKFKDSKEIREYEKLIGENVQIANVVKGYQDQTLRPNDNMTRIEALTLIINALEKLGW